MPRQKGMTQLELLRKKQAEIAEQVKAAEGRERERQKLRDNRRRDILGSMIDEALQSDPNSSLAQSVFRLIGEKLTKPADRALFTSLPPLHAAPRKAKGKVTSRDNAVTETA